MGTYYEGALVRVTAAFTNAAGAAVDPTTVTLKWHRNQDAITNWTVQAGQIVKDSVGNYHADLDTTNLPGGWSYEFEGTGAAQATNAGTFLVVSST